ncbi:AarF/UbiB family protein [Micromonospora sp. WMMD1120]|uniref:AarF/UbiB family protein n=1 Tax=Micromonospora sp. WMMD1120 TaxID=3016106 RepID=UPI0024168D3C|nr:AarF/UbiB family protein [Micromonospora sp. WMMD1120]MDG4810817.1 AarF/UbiB family protein [Micromonospora sp. WMMD1120]
MTPGRALPTPALHRLLVAETEHPAWAGPAWSTPGSVSEPPVAVGPQAQVHRAVWSDGRDVAVKIQHPGARARVGENRARMSRMAVLLRMMSPHTSAEALMDELQQAALAELDFRQEAANQQAFSVAYRDDPEIFVPEVVYASDRLLVTSWVAGVPLAEVIDHGPRSLRDRTGRILTSLQLDAPARVGLLHADPARDNLRLLNDGRLAVLDFGAVARLPAGLPPEFGELLRAAVDRDGHRLRTILGRLGVVADGPGPDPQTLLTLAEATVLPALQPGFRFDSGWLRRRVVALMFNRRNVSVVRHLRMPPGHLLLSRAIVGTVDTLCALEASTDYRAALTRWLPGFAPTDPRTERTG